MLLERRLADVHFIVIVHLNITSSTPSKGDTNKHYLKATQHYYTPFPHNKKVRVDYKSTAQIRIPTNYMKDHV